MTMQSLTSFSTEDIQATQSAMKIGLLATVNPQGLPHITMLSSLMACSPHKICFGQFTEGESKLNILTHPKACFLIMSLDRNLWRGRADYTHSSKSGPEFDFYNNIPMFRYNAYFGVHTVYYFDLVSHSGKYPLTMNRIIFAAIKTMLARTLGRKLEQKIVLNDWTRAFLNKLDNLKFLAYTTQDGYPVIIPTIQAQCLDAQHIILSTSAYREEIEAIPPGVDLCVFGLALSMEDVLLRGKYLGIQRKSGFNTALVELDWVYNPMPPVPGQIYPPQEIQPVKQF
ncbi:MAG: pyridoxamine 5'-phosphate oxidase family protein [Anaerolineales bacterium]|jgi:hypothetical protein